jgi:hypothetical protein
MSASPAPHRLLVCKHHGVMWKMRPYDGPAEYDMELRELCDRHNAQVPDPQNCKALIFRTDEETASKLDMETVLKNKLAEQDVYIKDFRDELKVDALKCFNRHNRPTQGCIDWCTEGKTVGRKVGVPPDKRQYLCMYCPAAQYYAHRERDAMGMYD